MDATIQNMMSLVQQKPLASAPRPTMDEAKADKASKDYETVFISQFLGSMFSGMPTDGVTGGGQGEEMFHSVLTDEYGKAAAKQGAGGLTDKIMHALLAQQEVKS